VSEIGGEEIMRRETIVTVFDDNGEIRQYLPKEERKNFKKEHPGYRLCMSLRFPYLPEYILGVATAIIILNIIINVAYYFITHTT